MQTMSSLSVPVIDISCFAAGESDAKGQARIAKELNKACSEIGFFYIVGHGCPPETLKNVFGAANDFFDSDTSVKEAVNARLSPLYRGYNSIETGAHSCTPKDTTHSHPDLKESFTIGAVDGGTPMHGPNQWPNGELLPNFEAALMTYWNSLLNTVVGRLLPAMAHSLELQDKDFFVKDCDSPVAQMVLLRYPATEEPEQRRGCGTHTDCGFMTILACDQPGLQVQRTDGTWMEAPPIENAFVVNMGDMMQRWTNDMYQSTPHRVKSSGVRRVSIPFFLNPNFHAKVECLPGCGPPKFPPTESGKYIMEELGLMHD